MTSDQFSLLTLVASIVIGVVYIDPARVPLSAIAGMGVMLFGVAIVAFAALVQVARDGRR